MYGKYKINLLKEKTCFIFHQNKRYFERLVILNQTRINCSFSSIDTKAASVIRLHQLVRIPYSRRADSIMASFQLICHVSSCIVKSRVGYFAYSLDDVVASMCPVTVKQ